MNSRVAWASLALKQEHEKESSSTLARPSFAHPTTPYCRPTVCQTQRPSQGLSRQASTFGLGPNLRWLPPSAAGPRAPAAPASPGSGMSDAASLSPPSSPHFPVVPGHLAPKSEACVRFQYSVLVSNFLGGAGSRFQAPCGWCLQGRAADNVKATGQAEQGSVPGRSVCAHVRGTAHVSLCFMVAPRSRKVCTCDYEYMRVHACTLGQCMCAYGSVCVCICISGSV